MTTERKFTAAVSVIRNLPKNGAFQPSTDLQLKFYSYFKQATEGPNVKPKPSFWDIPGQAKWHSWKKLGNMPKEDAMNAYIDELKSIVETMSYNANVESFLGSLGSFYDSVPAEDVDLVLGPVIEKVKSKSLTSRDPSPTRNMPPPEEYADSVEDIEPDPSGDNSQSSSDSLTNSGDTVIERNVVQDSEDDEEFSDSMESAPMAARNTGGMSLPRTLAFVLKLLAFKNKNKMVLAAKTRNDKKQELLQESCINPVQCTLATILRTLEEMRRDISSISEKIRALETTQAGTSSQTESDESQSGLSPDGGVDEDRSSESSDSDFLMEAQRECRGISSVISRTLPQLL